MNTSAATAITSPGQLHLVPDKNRNYNFRVIIHHFERKSINYYRNPFKKVLAALTDSRENFKHQEAYYYDIRNFVILIGSSIHRYRFMDDVKVLFVMRADAFDGCALFMEGFDAAMIYLRSGDQDVSAIR